MKRLKKRMLANSGFSYVITSVLMICVLLIGVAVLRLSGCIFRLARCGTSSRTR